MIARTSAKRDQWMSWVCYAGFYMMFGLIFGYLTGIMRVPIPGPTLPLPGILAFTVGNATRIGLGISLLSIFLAFGAFGIGLTVTQMRRMSGPGPALAYAYLATSSLAALPGVYFCGLCFAAAAFRLDRNPHIIAFLYDMGFVGFVGFLGCFVVQYMVFATAIFLDKNEIFPKWLGYITIWGILTELVAAPVWVFREGPYAWNGMISFYLGTMVYVVWITSLMLMLARSINKYPVEDLNPLYVAALRAKGLVT
jgi:hypothetical protein